jgi:hypothetical protein
MRKAQSPQSSIALLIFMIGVAIIVYILMLPPADRAVLLEQNRTHPGSENVKDTFTVLMTQEPGRLTNIADTEITYDLPSFNLFTRTDATVLTELDSIYVSKSLFDEQFRNITFKIDSFEDTDNYVLSFTAPKRSGILTIQLNGYTIMSNELSTQSPGSIKLSKDLLKPENTLVFRVSGPGIEFWKSNEYLLQDMKITADVTDSSSHENKQIVLVTEQQKENLESFELSFIIDCKSSDVSPLEIYLNKRLIYSSVPDCGGRIKVPAVDESRLRQGENDLTFMTDKGSYLLYGIETTLNLKKPIFPTYFFTLNTDTYNKIKAGTADINVTILFTNDVDRKKATVSVNGMFTDLDTYDNSYSRLINSFVREGNNAVEIQPKVDILDILELKIVLAE